MVMFVCGDGGVVGEVGLKCLWNVLGCAQMVVGGEGDGAGIMILAVIACWLLGG